MLRLLIPAALAVLFVLATPASAFACEFQLGFKTLRDAVGHDVVGDCLEDEHYNEIGDSVQQTTGGLLVWRKADNWTAFTDGYQTWLAGPDGLAQRLNSERFEWEWDTLADQAITLIRGADNPNATKVYHYALANVSIVRGTLLTFDEKDIPVITINGPHSYYVTVRDFDIDARQLSRIIVDFVVWSLIPSERSSMGKCRSDASDRAQYLWGFGPYSVNTLKYQRDIEYRRLLELGRLEKWVYRDAWWTCAPLFENPEPNKIQIIDPELRSSLKVLRTSGPLGEYWYEQIMVLQTSVKFAHFPNVEYGHNYWGFADGPRNTIAAWHPDLIADGASRKMAKTLVHEMMHILQHKERQRTNEKRTKDSCYQDEIEAEIEAQRWWSEATGMPGQEVTLETFTSSVAHVQLCESFDS